ncbi:MAG: FAD-dependent monooxygenase [Pseudomonadota bacterium]
MRIACIGGGVAALYFSIAMKRLDPGCAIDIFERDSQNKQSGWGIILREAMLDAMREVDPASHAAIVQGAVGWDVIEIALKGQKKVLSSQFGRSIGRHALVEVLRARTAQLGCRIHYSSPLQAAALAGDYDMLVGSDGIKSGCRQQVGGDSGIASIQSKNRFVWLGCDHAFDKMVFDFQQTAHGPVWVHAYPFSTTRSTFVVECSEQTFERIGFGRAPLTHDIGVLEQMFGELLNGARLIGLSDSPAEWRRFEQIRCAALHKDGVVLIGDAAHTAHFSIGSGTRLAVEDAIALASSLAQGGALPQAFLRYQERRREAVGSIAAQALNSMRWFDGIVEHYTLPIGAFARAFMFRSLQTSP